MPDSSASDIFDQQASLAYGANLDLLPRAYPRIAVHGIIRETPHDFVVTEILPFSLSGTGEHLYIKVRKTSQNTRWVARQLAQRCDLPLRSVSFAGMKDRHAVTEQWFSLHCPGRPDPDLATSGIDGVEVIESSRHAVKLRRGMLAGNRFRIVVRGLAGDVPGLQARLEELRSAVIPNYFGAQRFGKDAGNLQLLDSANDQRTPDREARSFGLSALRSALFNGYLAQRIDAGTWQQALPGEIAYDEAEETYRHVDAVVGREAGYRATGLLWGCGQNKATGLALESEAEFFERMPDITKLLATYEVRMMRRPLGLVLREFQWALSGGSLELSFMLKRGMYATAVLREIANVTEATAP